MKTNSSLEEDTANRAGGSRKTTEEEVVVDEVTATGRRKRKDVGAVREKARSWSDEEEKLFLESLELHGIAPSSDTCK